MIGNVISAGANIIGGLIGAENMEDERTRQNTVYWNNVKMQQNQAAHAIKQRVDDAREAGIHPLYALSASTPTFSPVSVGGVSGNPMGAALAAAGQDIGRAVNATMPAGERAAAWDKTVQDLNVTNMSLKNELLRAQIAKINQGGGNPPAPAVIAAGESGSLPPIGSETKQDDRPVLQVGGVRWQTDPTTSNMKKFEDRYGDEGPVTWAAQMAVAMRDLQTNLSSMKFLDILRAIDQKTALGWNLPSLKSIIGSPSTGNIERR